jgi:hypothetical protein
MSDYNIAKINYNVACLELTIACVNVSMTNKYSILYVIEALKNADTASIKLNGYFVSHNIEPILIDIKTMEWIMKIAPYLSWLFTTY